MSAARPQVNIIEPHAKKEYFGFSSGSPRTIFPYLEPAIYNEYRSLANVIRNTNKKVYLVVNEECTSKIFKDILSTYEKDILKEENECPICGSSLIIKPTDDKEELACSNEKCSYHRDINEN